jgi:hypothetical protein
LWADEQWMSRFAGTMKPKKGIPDCVGRYDCDDLKRVRVDVDHIIIRLGTTLYGSTLKSVPRSKQMIG